MQSEPEIEDQHTRCGIAATACAEHVYVCKHMCICIQRETQRARERDRQRQRDRERERDRERHSARERDRENGETARAVDGYR